MKLIKFSSCILSLLISLPLLADNLEVIGKKAYDNNCKACHSADRFSVGPSLVEIRKKYPKEKQASFLAWAKNPGKKNPKTIQMPSMAHVGEDNLKAIHHYILLSTKYLKEKKTKPKFQFKAPKRQYPFVKRAFVPFASPASVAVGINESSAIIWDTTKLTTRYAYPGKQNIYSGENKLKQNKKHVIYQETAQQFWSIANGNNFDYKGFRLKNGLPTFLYNIGKTQISEQILAATNTKGFKRRYKISGLNSPLTLDLSHQGKAKISANKGNLVNDKLTLTAKESTDFTIEVTFQ